MTCSLLHSWRSLLCGVLPPSARPSYWQPNRCDKSAWLPSPAHPPCYSNRLLVIVITEVNTAIRGTRNTGLKSGGCRRRAPWWRGRLSLAQMFFSSVSPVPPVFVQVYSSATWYVSPYRCHVIHKAEATLTTSTWGLERCTYSVSTSYDVTLYCSVFYRMKGIMSETFSLPFVSIFSEI